VTQSSSGILGRDLLVIGVCLLGTAFVCSAVFLGMRLINPRGTYYVELAIAWRIAWELLVAWLLSLIVLRLTPPVEVSAIVAPRKENPPDAE
jgi:hypothetical protein